MRLHALLPAVLAALVHATAWGAVQDARDAGGVVPGDAARTAEGSPGLRPAGPGPAGAGPAARPDTVLRPDLLRPRPLDPLGADGRRVPLGRPPWLLPVEWTGLPSPLLSDPGALGARPRIRLGLKPLPVRYLDVPPPPGITHPLVRPAGRDPAAVWLAELGARAREDAALRVALERSMDTFGRRSAADPLAFLLPPDSLERPARREPRREPDAGDPEEAATNQIPGLVPDYADLFMRVQTRAELGGDWSRFRPCQDRFQESCNPRLFPRVSPDLSFDVQVGGAIADRIHVDVDFDQAREFGASNRINLFYEGVEDDIVQRLEVGDVTFALPPSRFLTRGLPTGNFGFQAQGQLGPMELQGVFAQQKGDLNSRVFGLEGVGDQRRFVQDDTLVLDDADYARGQFFFLVDPEAIERYPHVDILSLDAGSASADLLPGVEPVQLYRFEANPVRRQQVEGFIQADAVAEEDGDRVVESGWFRYLQPDQDYFVHPSGLWVALRSPLSRDEMLAVTYVTAVGDTVGDYNPEAIYARGGRPELRLLKGSGATHQPGRPTWEQEMRNIYRVSGAPDVDPTSVDVTISLGELSAGRTFVRSREGEDLTWLQLMGLDQESPLDVVDPAFVYQPGADLFQGQPAVEGTFVVFPTLEPFLRPPPLPSLGLTEEDTRELLGDRANRRIYDDPDPFERQNGGLFRLTIPFRVRSQGVISSFSLGALGIRPGSERVFLGEQLLIQGVDYEIDYDIGQVRLLEPDVLFSTRPDASIRVTWEQQQMFQQAPVSVAGLQGRAALADIGSLNFIGLYQAERTLATRPTLGVEPGAMGLGGMSGDVAFELPFLDRALGQVPGLRASGTSSLTVEGEAAMSLPNPNTRGDVFLDDFDASEERRLSLLSWDWQRGSAPTSRDGAEDALPPDLDQFSLAELVWQHQWIIQGVGGDSLGIHEGFLPRQEIDQQIRVAGSQVREPGLHFSFGTPETHFQDDPRWASVTTVLSQTGTDLTRSEFLEFYVRGGENASLIVDLGSVSEDAFFVSEEGTTAGVKVDGTPWGLGFLDQEADPSRGQIWGDEADERGVWAESCEAEPGRIYPLGDVDAVCTRNNGRQDSEDLDGDGNLDDREKHLRYVVRLGRDSPFLVRDQGDTGTPFRLYRIPIEGPNAVQVGGPFTEADLRSVKHLRLTVTGDRRGTLTLTRFRIVGARWVKRADEGVVTGIVGDTTAFTGRVEVQSVSRLTEGSGYESPPGVLEELADPTSAIGTQGVEFNEKSLALRFEDVMPGDRVEVYNRFPQRPRNFLEYRDARLWAVARSGDFGTELPHDVFFKVGSDTENFYLFRTPLSRPVGGSDVARQDWLPEIVIRFGVWLDLRRRAEEELIRNPRSPGDPPVTLWSEDGQYAVVLRDRGRAPDLANVREMSLGVWNRGEGPIQGEVWFDELRLSRPVRETGLAGFFNVALDAGDLLESRVGWTTRGSFFRQLQETPTYQTDRIFSFDTRVALERFLPSGWGVALPLTVTHDRATQDPHFLTNSDLRGDLLPGLRDIGTRRTRVSMGFRKTAPSANPVMGALLDGLDANVAWFNSESGAVTSRLESSGVDGRVGYNRQVDRREVGLVPGIFEDVVRFLLPEWLEERFLDIRLRWTPERFSVGTGYQRQDNDIFRYEQIIELEQDSLVVATRAPRESLETAADVTFRPFESLTAGLTLLSTRDLLPPADVVSDRRVQELLAAERRSLAGLDLGWETRRTLRSRLGFAPRFVPWLRHEIDWSTAFLSERNSNFVERTPTGATGDVDPETGAAVDTLLALQRNASGDRNMQAIVSFDPGGMARDLVGGNGAGDEAEGAGASRWRPTAGGEPGEQERIGGPGDFIRVMEALRPLTLNWSDGLASRFNRDPVSPGLGYQLGFGDPADFRFLDGDTAAFLSERTTTRLSSGVELPLGVEMLVGWSEGDVTALDVRSERTIHTETWPDVRFSTTLPGGIPRTPVDRITLSSGFQRNDRDVTYTGLSEQRRREVDRRIPVELAMGWGGFTTLLYTGAFQVGEGFDPTGDTEREGVTHRLSVASTFTPPEMFASRLDAPVRTSLILSWQSEEECREARFRDDCVLFVDQLNRGVSLNLDTSMSGFEVGLQGAWTARQSTIGTRIGSTQFQLGLWGQFLFEAGRPGAGL